MPAINKAIKEPAINHSIPIPVFPLMAYLVGEILTEYFPQSASASSCFISLDIYVKPSLGAIIRPLVLFA